MRMRKKKHSEERLAACGEYLFTTDELLTDPAAAIGM